MSAKFDLTHRRFGKLTVERLVGSWPEREGGEPQRRWECECACGGSKVATTSELTGGRVRSCDDCKRRDAAPNYIRDYVTYREQFTPEQRAQYERIMSGRKGRQAEAEAVDLVMRESVV